MTYESLEEKMTRLVDFEKNNSVTQWKCSGIDYWPIVKNIVYFEYRRTNRNFLKNMLHSPGAILKKGIKRLMSKQPKVLSPNRELYFNRIDIMCSGANTHRAVHNGVSYNKYFDPIMDTVAPHFSSLLCDYSTLPNVVNHPKRVLPIGIDLNRKSSDFSIDQGLRDNIKLISMRMSVSESFLLHSIEKAGNRILQWKDRWLEVLKKTTPSVVMVLCYYNEPMYGLILACRESNIPTVDMQHGGQGKLHPAYTFYSENANDFNTLPDYFWVWDSSSGQSIKSWLARSRPKVIEGGNPWITFLSAERQEAHTKNIICTLTIGLDHIIPEYLIKAILSSSGEYKWYLRMHPRTDSADRKKLYSIIEKYKLKEKVNITEANTEPLPLLLNSAWAHVSHSSGSIAEAALMGVEKNVITSEIGRMNYENLIRENKASFFNPESNGDLFAFLLKTAAVGAIRGPIYYNYKRIIDDVIKKDESLFK